MTEPKPEDDGLTIPEFLRRKPKPKPGESK
jgi:hypothetical protein